MSKFLDEIEKWFNSENRVKILINNHIDNFEDYSINKDMFIYEESIVRNKLITTFISSYFKKIEKYIMIYEPEFTFSNYNNFQEFNKNTDNKRVIYFLEWFKEDNIPLIKKFINQVKEEKVDLKSLYDVIKYYDFLVRDSFETNNFEATLDFLIGLIRNVMTQSMELTIKARELTIEENFKNDTTTSHDIELEKYYLSNEEYLGITLNQLTISNLKNSFESAEKQTFLLRKITLLNIRRLFKWKKFHNKIIMIFN